MAVAAACADQQHLQTVARDLAKYRLHVMELQEVRWDRGGTAWRKGCIFLYGEVLITISQGQEFLDVIAKL
jgi:hypothetical protein